MIKRNILKNVAKPVGNYPHSIEIGEFLFISGIGPRQCDDNSIPGNEYDSNGNLKKYFVISIQFLNMIKNFHLI